MAVIHVSHELLRDLETYDHPTIGGPLAVLDALQKALMLPWAVTGIDVQFLHTVLRVNAPGYAQDDLLKPLYTRTSDGTFVLREIEHYPATERRG